MTNNGNSTTARVSRTSTSRTWYSFCCCWCSSPCASSIQPYSSCTNRTTSWSWTSRSGGSTNYCWNTLCISRVFCPTFTVSPSYMPCWSCRSTQCRPWRLARSKYSSIQWTLSSSCCCSSPGPYGSAQSTSLTQPVASGMQTRVCPMAPVSHSLSCSTASLSLSGTITNKAK